MLTVLNYAGKTVTIDIVEDVLDCMAQTVLAFYQEIFFMIMWLVGTSGCRGVTRALRGPDSSSDTMQYAYTVEHQFLCYKPQMTTGWVS